MTAHELWVCDYHAADGPYGESDVVNEDEARETGWARVERRVRVESAIEGGKPWTRHEVGHICPECLKDPDCLEWVERERWEPYFDEDRERLEQAKTQTGVER